MLFYDTFLLCKSASFWRGLVLSSLPDSHLEISRNPPVSGGLNRSIYRIVAVAGAAGLLFGYDTAVINGALVFLRVTFRLPEGQTEFAASSLLWGCLAGALLAGPMSDRYGRKKLLLLSGVLFFLSALGSAVPRTFEFFLIARAIGGLGIGMASTLAPVYLAELAPARQRGRLITVNQLAIVTGILVAYLAGWAFSFLGTSSWRWMFGSAALPAGVFALCVLTIPESPRWLLERGREGAARAILEALHGPLAAEAEVREITEATLAEKAGLDALLGRLRKPLVLAICLAVLQQIGGINTVLYYGAVLFKEHTGVNSQSAVGANVLIGAVNFVFTLIAIAIVDRVKRRALLATSAGIMAFSLIALSQGFHLVPTPFPFVIGCILVYVAAFATGVGPGVWIYIAELFPTPLRGRAMSIATAALWGACILVTNTFLTAVRLLTPSGAFLFYAAMCGILAGFVFLLPETRGRSLEEIAGSWQKAETTSEIGE